MREFSEVDEFQTVITREGVRDEITLRVELKSDARMPTLGRAGRDAAQAPGPRPRGPELPHRARRRGRAAPLRAQGQAHRSTSARRRSGRRRELSRTGPAGRRAHRRRGAAARRLRGAQGAVRRGSAARRRGQRARRAGPHAQRRQRAGAALRAPERPRRLSLERPYADAMRIAVAGGGPGGLYFSILMRRVAPDCEITVFERNRAEDAFGFGVVFSDETLTVFEHADPRQLPPRSPTASSTGPTSTSTTAGRRRGRAATASPRSGRRELLGILQRAGASLGAEIRFCRGAARRRAGAELDLVVAADGASSAGARRARRGLRARAGSPRLPLHVDGHRPGLRRVQVLHRRDRRTASSRPTPIPTATRMSTFIVEMAEDDVAPRRPRRAGRRARCRPGVSDEASVAFCQELFADALEGHPLLANNSKWISFVTVRNACWRAGNVVLLGDAAHTAHFSIGSGTKLAMEDAVALAWAFREHGPTTSRRRSRPTRPSAARWSSPPSAPPRGRWSGLRGSRRYVGQPPAAVRLQPAHPQPPRHLRQPAPARRGVRGRRRRAASPSGAGSRRGPPMFPPLRLRGLELPNRVVVSPMDMYSAVDGTPSDFHLVHLGGRALGGAGAGHAPR